MKENAVYYARVSTDKSDQEQSFEAQQQYFKSIGITKGFTDKGLTGTSINREGFVNMLFEAGLDVVKIRSGSSYKYATRISDREPKFNMIYTKSISRFSRDIATAIQVVRELRQKGIGVFFLDINKSSLDPTTDLLLSIMFSISTEESRTMSGRIKFGNKQSAINGNIRSIKLYGYTYNKEEKSLQIIPEEAEVVKLMYQLRLEGKGSRQISNYLNDNGYRTRSNTKWLPNVINRLLQNKTYCGYSVRNKFDCDMMFGSNSHKVRDKEEWIEVKTDKIPPIISEEDFEKVQQLITQSLSKDSRGVYVGKGELASKVICGKCGHTYYRCQDKKKNKNGEYLIVSYRCSNKKRNGKSACDSKNVPEEEIYNALKARSNNYKQRAEALVKYIDKLVITVCDELESLKNKSYDDIIVSTQKDIAECKSQLETILNMFLEGKIIEEVYNKKRLQLEQQLHRLTQQLETYENPNDKLQAKIDRAKEITTKARKIYEEIPDTIDVSYFIEHYLSNITIVPVEDEPEIFPKGYDIVVNHYIKDMLIELKSMVEDCKIAKKGD